MLSGYACAIPAVMATRTIESRRDRLLTMLVVPLSSCSARLPVYVLLIATVFPGNESVGLGFSMGAVVLLAMYLLSATSSLAAAAVLRRTVLRGPRPTMVLELPPYRAPVIRNLLLATWRQLRSFLIDAGSIILALTIVMWALLSYPKDAAVAHDFSQRRAAVETLPEAEQEQRMSELDEQEAGAQLRNSVAGRLGRGIEPALEPLGLDWRVGIGVLARSLHGRCSYPPPVWSSTSPTPTRKTSPCAKHCATRKSDGSLLFTPASGLALIILCLACQCMSTIAVVRRESGSWKWPAFMFGYMTVLAYIAALLTYQLARLLSARKALSPR